VADDLASINGYAFHHMSGKEASSERFRGCKRDVCGTFLCGSHRMHRNAFRFEVPFKCTRFPEMRIESKLA
jgi:hypothetical protein